MADSPAAGWYDDPSDSTNLRYWDGAAWTPQIRPKHGGAAPSAAPTMHAPPPPNYLAQAILATILCCLPLGIVAIVKSSSVNSLWQSGRHDAAYAASTDAKRWAWISAFVAIGVYVLMGLAGFVFYLTGGFDTARDAFNCTFDTSTLETAEDAYYAQAQRYAGEETLVADGFLAGPSALHDIVLNFEGASYRIVVADNRCGSVGEEVQAP
jgi:hypothetical protein